MSGHTPAPWHSYPMPTKTHAEAAANRQVAIAAADLLEALTQLKADAESHLSGNTAETKDSLWHGIETAAAAIAKATNP